ncbi:spermatogenesis associated 32 [Phyllostomus discolor]|uniref:Spermatogenesis associated 32 n=1 Tax=Phyllostomus discolor TaxID=89673 RepID=A0A833ZNQ6_9CHIR|nr:spermatogenesis associated 32 [Phyllostomus discolor]
MGVTGANGFPCCTKDSVDIIDTQIDINQRQFQLGQREDEPEEDKLLELEPPHKMDLDTEPEVEVEEEEEEEEEEEAEAVPPLEWCLAPTLKPEAKLSSNLEAGHEDLEEERYRVEPIHPYMEEPPEDDTQQVGYPTPVEEAPATPSHNSIHVQTSKHLFWADKITQASEQNLQRETSGQLSEKSSEKTISPLNQESVPKDAPSSEKPLQSPSTPPEPPDAGSGQPSSTHSSSSLPAVISLQDVVNLATSLAIASSSKVDLSGLEYVMKAPQQKSMEPSPAPPPSVESATPRAKEEPEQEKPPELLRKPPEKLLEAGDPKKVCKQKDENKLPLHLDLSKLGSRKAIIEGKVTFLQTPVTSPPQTRDRKDPGPGTKKGSPLLLKIHFKLSSPASPEK